MEHENLLREKTHQCQNLEREIEATREEFYAERKRGLDERHMQMELAHMKIDMRRMLTLISGTKEFEAFKVG